MVGPDVTGVAGPMVSGGHRQCAACTLHTSESGERAPGKYEEYYPSQFTPACLCDRLVYFLGELKLSFYITFLGKMLFVKMLLFWRSDNMLHMCY